MSTRPNYGEKSLEDLIAAADDSVKDAFANGRGLREFLATIDRLEEGELISIVDQAIRLLEGFYVHLPLKRAMHAVDPLQRLRLLRRRVSLVANEISFHHEMTDIFTSLRDLHTNYILPIHFARMVAFLPFRIEACHEDGERRYILGQVAPGFSHPTFVPGVRLTYWNGIPIDRAVEIAASYHAGSNPAARHARGVAGLTKRAMNISPPPDEEWVLVGYTDQGGNECEFRAEWTISGLPDEGSGAEVPSAAVAAAMGLDLEGDVFRRINKMLFSQHLIAEKKRIDTVRKSKRDAARLRSVALGDVQTDAVVRMEADAELEAASETVQGTESTMPDVFSAQVVEIDGRSFGYVRIATFHVNDDIPFVNEFLRLIELPEMPKNGLIIDVRGNGGGLIWAGERLLQLLTPNPIEPCRLQFICTPANLELCNAPSLQSWLPSLSRAAETGAPFSASFPITPPERCNDIGQRYYGPVVLITDGLCYSTTDIFAAGFQDHKIGAVLGVDNNTGAGGANVWTLDLIRRFFSDAGKTPPVEPLPKLAGMRVAIRRTVRVGAEAGTELEDLGVRPDEEHKLTRDDILNGNRDLLARAAQMIIASETNGKTAVSFAANVRRSGQTLHFDVNARGVDYVDVFIDRRARGSYDVQKTTGVLGFKLSAAVTGGAAGGASDIELRGYAARQSVCYRRLSA